MAQLPLSNVINISVSEAQQGVGEYSVNNLAIFTHDTYGSTFGTLGYSIYLSPQQAGVDFGTSSVTYQLIENVFSQQPNVLAGNGYVVAIPFLPAEQELYFNINPGSGSAIIGIGGSTIVISAGQSVGSVQAVVQAISGLSEVEVTGGVGDQNLYFTYYGYYGTPPALTVGSNTMMNGTNAVVLTPMVVGSGETLSAAISRTEDLVQYFGILPDKTIDIMGSTDVLAAALTVQSLNKMVFMPSWQSGDLGSSGLITALTDASYTQSRGLYYGGSSYITALDFASCYAGLALSTNFDGNNTTQTMHLKTLIGIPSDPTLTQTLLNEAQTAGADVYANLQGVAKVFTSGANMYFDQVYGTQWLAGALQVAGFNYLAETATKIPQTEQGMTGLKGAYRAVCQQGVVNDFVAPGSWNSSTTFGNQIDFLSNVNNIGYYIYSLPVSQQSQTARAARQAPLVQIAIKLAGAIQSSDVIVFINP